MKTVKHNTKPGIDQLPVRQRRHNLELSVHVFDVLEIDELYSSPGRALSPIPAVHHARVMQTIYPSVMKELARCFSTV